MANCLYVNNIYIIYHYIPRPTKPWKFPGFQNSRGFPERTGFFMLFPFLYNIFTYCPSLWVRTTCHMTAEFVLMLFICFQGWRCPGLGQASLAALRNSAWQTQSPTLQHYPASHHSPCENGVYSQNNDNFNRGMWWKTSEFGAIQLASFDHIWPI